MRQKIVCHEGRCTDKTYPSWREMYKDPVRQIEYELLKRDASF